MAKSVHPDVLDGALAVIATGTRVVLTDTGTLTFTTANIGGSAHIAAVTVTAGLGGGDWGSAVNGESLASAGGRSTQLAAQTTAVATAAKTASHIAVLDVGNSKLLAVNELSSSVAVAIGNTNTIPATEWNQGDPA